MRSRCVWSAWILCALHFFGSPLMPRAQSGCCWTGCQERATSRYVGGFTSAASRTLAFARGVIKPDCFSTRSCRPLGVTDASLSSGASPAWSVFWTFGLKLPLLNLMGCINRISWKYNITNISNHRQKSNSQATLNWVDLPTANLWHKCLIPHRNHSSVLFILRHHWLICYLCSRSLIWIWPTCPCGKVSLIKILLKKITHTRELLSGQ